MKVKVIAAFNDMSIADPDTRRREIGDEFEVADPRGIELSALKLVEPVAADVVEGARFGGSTLDLTPQPAPTPVADAPTADTLHLTADMAAPAAAAPVA